MAFDEKCYLFLKNLSLEHVTIDLVSDFETPELLAVKPTRTRAEYCWTCGPSVIYHFITKYNLDACTYIDADLMFFSSPQIIYDEIGQASVGITEHFTDEADTGRFCVQFVFFRNNDSGMAALTWWRDKCIEWCYNRFEDGKFGDQKYVESFPVLFNDVHIIENRGVGVACWNMYQYQYELKRSKNLIFDNRTIPIVFFHYHGIILELKNEELFLKVRTFDFHKKQGSDIECLLNEYLLLLVEVYKYFFNKDIKAFHIVKRKFYKRFTALLKKTFRKNKFAQFICHDLLKIKFTNREQQQVI
jgi:hypothetical protein